MADTKQEKAQAETSEKTADKPAAKKTAKAPKPVWDVGTHGECPYPDQYEVIGG